MKEILNHILSKVFSGKWLLTVACAIAFVWCVVNKQLEAAAIAAVVTSVFGAYFSKDNKNGKNGDKSA